MSKVMVVEDDASLREIYSIRVTAEGYDVVSAGDGEEALAVAVREKPDLILSDVMMPKISGFDMLDILRSTPETANIKVVMMTALSADDQRQRGERLGADRYLVKSQVGIEDVINTIHEVLGDREPTTAAASGAVPAAMPEVAPAATPEVVTVESTGASPAVPGTTPMTPGATTSTVPEAAPVTSEASMAPQPAPQMAAPTMNPVAAPAESVAPAQVSEPNPYGEQSANPAQ